MPKQSTITKDAIYNAALELIKVQDLNTLNVSLITKHAGCNRCTFYNFYDGLDDLMQEIEENLIQEIQTSLIKINSHTLYTPEQVFEIFQSTFQQYGDLIFKLLLLGSGGDFSMRSKVRDIVIQNFRTYQNSQADPVLLEYIFSFVFSGALGMMEYWKSAGDSVDEGQFIQILRSIIQKGVIETSKLTLKESEPGPQK